MEGLELSLYFIIKIKNKKLTKLSKLIKNKKLKPLIKNKKLNNHINDN